MSKSYKEIVDMIKEFNTLSLSNCTSDVWQKYWNLKDGIRIAIEEKVGYIRDGSQTYYKCNHIRHILDNLAQSNWESWQSEIWNSTGLGVSRQHYFKCLM